MPPSPSADPPGGGAGPGRGSRRPVPRQQKKRKRLLSQPPSCSPTSPASFCAPPLVCFSGSHGRASSLPACSWGERRRRTRPRSRAGCLSPGVRLGLLLAPPAPRQKGSGLLPCAHPGQRMRRSLALDPGARWAPAGKESSPQTRVFRGWETRAPVHKRARRRRGEIGARIDVPPHFWRSQRLAGAGATPALPTRPGAEIPEYKRLGDLLQGARWGREVSASPRTERITPTSARACLHTPHASEGSVPAN